MASQLHELPLQSSVLLQEKIQSLITTERFYIKQSSPLSNDISPNSRVKNLYLVFYIKAMKKGRIMKMILQQQEQLYSCKQSKSVFYEDANRPNLM